MGSMTVVRTGVFALLALPLLGQGNSNNVRALNARLLQLHGAIQSAGASEASALRSQASGVITERAAALTGLIRENPGQALGLAFSQDLLDDLKSKFPEAASQLEQHGQWAGTSTHLIFDNPARNERRWSVRIRSGNELLEINSATGEPGCHTGQTLSVQGVRVNNVVAAGNANVQGAVAGAGCSTTGVQNSAVILVQFPGVSLPGTVTNPSVQNIFFATSGKSVNTYWQEASYGKTSAAGNTFGPYTLDRVYSCSEYDLMRQAAMNAADADVYFPNYSRVFIVFPDPGSCGWAGLGMLGCGSFSTPGDGSFTASVSWLLATYMDSANNGVRLSTHEGGHNLTLHHASTRLFSGEALGNLGVAGTLDEYGDHFNTMGYWNFGQYNAPHKAMMGWLSSGTGYQVVQSSGTYTIVPIENNGGGIQALKVQRGTGNSAWMWLEFRQPIGQYDSTLNSNVYNGALVHYEDSTTGTHTHLLDFTPGSGGGFDDGALTSSWTDPYSNLSLSVAKVPNGSSYNLSVGVNYGALPCNVAQPTVTISPSNPTVNAGSNASQTVTVTNNDSAGCGSATFSFASTLPSGWVTTFSPGTLALAPGQTASVTMTKTTPSGTTGTFGVNATASDLNHSATGGANVTLVLPPPPPPPLTITLSAPATVKFKGTIAITATVWVSGALRSGATVTFTVTRPGGSGAQTATATTNSAGVAVLNYKAQQKGSYTAKATGTYGSSTNTSNQISFTAN